MAKPAAVLPDDDSKMRWPATRLPFFSASSIMALAALSLTLPAGLRPSSFMKRRTRRLGLSSLTSTKGVLPMVSRTLSKRATSAPGDRWHQGDNVRCSDLGVHLAQVTDIVVVEEDVEVPVHVARGGEQRRAEAGVLADQVLEHFTEVGPICFDRGFPAGHGPQDIRQAHFD